MDQMQSLLEELGLNQLSEVKKQALFNEFEQVMYRRLLVRFMDIVPDDVITQAEQLIQQGDTDAVLDLLTTHVPDLEQVVKREIDTLEMELYQKERSLLAEE